MRHNPHMTFVDRSVPQEKEEGRVKTEEESAVVDRALQGEHPTTNIQPTTSGGELELAVPGSARAEHLAGDPRAAALQREFQVAFQKKFAVFAGGFKSLLHEFVDKAEQGRQIGVLLNEFAEVALPGKRLTLDFYRQHSAMFTDGQGQTIPLAMLEWFMKVARARGERAIVDMQTALEWQKPFLKAPEDELFTLVSDRAPGERAPQRDEWAKMVAWVEGSELPETWKALRENPAYFPGGHIREDLRETVREEWKPIFKILEEVKKELGL